MICPKCGKEIEEGKLYCEFCGEEIKIVPDFDPEIENSITQILSDVADEAIEWHSKKNSETESELSEEGDDSDEDNRLRKEFLAKNLKVVGIMGAIFIVLILAFGLLWFFLDYRYTNYEYQLDKASKHVSKGELVEAAETYRHILELKGHDSLATYYLANVSIKD